MRRLAVLSLAPIAMAAIALGACSSGNSGTPDAASSATSASAGPAAGGSASPDPSTEANRQQVCAALNQAISKGASAFGTDLGTLVGHLSGGNKTAAAASRTKALADLKTLSVDLRTAAQPATDPAVKAAAEMVANNVAKLANDPTLLAKAQKTSDLTAIIEKLTRATDPLVGTCA